MIKGGFQGLDICGVDLTAQSPTLPGAYAACQAAAGKTVLVLTAAGAVQCSVKKVSTNYVLAGITGDGKILSITIGSTDGISVSETTPGGGDIAGGSTSPVSLDTSNASVANPYIVPDDGYIRIENTSTSVDNTTAVAIPYPDRSNALPLFWEIPAGTSSRARREAFFVRKGTPIAVAAKASNTNVVFIALVSA